MPYSQSFKKQILAQCRSSASISTIAKEHSVPRSTIYRWHKEENLVETSDRIYSSKDIKALERRVAKLEKINAILKGVPCTVHAPLRERLDALEQLHSEYDVHTLCEAPEVSRGTYYNHIRRNKRDDVWYKKREEKYRILIRDVFYEFDQVLGANKICAVLKERGHAVTPKYVARIMDDLGLTSIRTDAKRIYDSQRKNPQHFAAAIHILGSEQGLGQRCHLFQVQEPLVLYLCHPGSLFPHGDSLAHWQEQQCPAVGLCDPESL